MIITAANVQQKPIKPKYFCMTYAQNNKAISFSPNPNETEDIILLQNK